MGRRPFPPVEAAAARRGGPRDVWALGLMSGTSLDGVDAVVLRTDGHRALFRGPGLSVPYPPAFRARLRAALGDARLDDPANAAPARELTDLHAAACLRLLRRARLRPRDIAVVGFPGQTLHHDPARGITRQLADAPRLARRLRLPVVYDFRSADIAAGGQGAPLVPLFHAALFAHLPGPLAVLNIGGVANVTWIGEDGALSAFDIGPGNAPLDDFMLARTGRPLDRDGACAAAGRVEETLLRRWLQAPFFHRPPPKSLDRRDFTVTLPPGLSTPDGAATLTAFIAAGAAAAQAHFPAPPRRWLVCGGGRRNAALMRMLALRLGVPVVPVEAAGRDGDLLEAAAFAFLAVRRLAGLPASLPETTGAARPTVGGRLALPGRVVATAWGGDGKTS